MEPEAYRKMAEVEKQHWWFRGRRHVVRRVIERLELPESPRVLDAGCGTGGNFNDLAGFGDVVGVEPDPWAVDIARQQGIGDVIIGTIEQLPLDDETFDLIACLDVLEHVVDDRAGMRELRRVAKPNAFLLVTVPAYLWLWSHHDVVSRHYRRYTARELLQKAQSTGWKPFYNGYFNSLALGPAIVVRRSQRLRRRPPKRQSDLEITPPLVNRILELPIRVEACLLRRGVRIPAGLSVLAVLRAE